MARIPYIKYRRPTERQRQSVSGRRYLLRRGVVSWLSRGKSSHNLAVGLEVPTGLSGDLADVAAFWSGTRTQGGRRLLEVKRSCLVVCALDRAECYAASINPDLLFEELCQCRARKESLEEEIRRTEPQLRDNHTLFEEYADWHYEETQNPEYLKCIHRAKELEDKLYRGTRMDRLRRCEAGDLLYLAVPEGVVRPEEVMPGWGVLSMSAEGKMSVLREALPQDVRPAMRNHLGIQIALRASEFVCAGMGLSRGRK